MGGSTVGEPEDLTLVGWGVESTELDSFMVRAREVGFDVLITSTADPVKLEAIVEVGARHGIEIFSCIAPMGGLRRLWMDAYPDTPIPWQVMNPDQEAAFNFISSGRNRFIIPYQWGGEPKMENEVLDRRIICHGSRQALDLFKPVIDEIVAVPGIGGLAMDGFGYQNYKRCYCDNCKVLFAEYRRNHAELSEDAAEVNFFRDLLVDAINYLADYARSQNESVQTTLHIWPVFVPEPLYGNRLDVDFCGQTAAWYTLWPEEKIASYSQTITADAQRYHRRQTGVGMIGYYDMPGRFPVKSGEVVDRELATMIENGCRRIQVCGTSDVINNPEVAAVFRKYFHTGPPADNPASSEQPAR